jgi:hypothetical protein
MIAERPLFALLVATALGLPACGGGSSTPSEPGPAPTATPVPTPAPTPTPSQPAACQLKAPTADCSKVALRPQMLADDLQAAAGVAIGTPGAMYSEYPNRIRDLDLFRKKMVDDLAAKSMCGAWDFGNVTGDEIFVRSADGCVAEQYDLITGDGGVRVANKGSNAWQEGWGAPVPDPKPVFSREGDLTCSLPGDRSTFCFSIKNTRGEFGTDVYALLAEVLNENPPLFDKNDFVEGGNREFVPSELRLPSWRIVNLDAYIAAVEKKLRGRGFCGFVENGDILKIKKVSVGNMFHEEMDIVQNPPSGGAYVLYVIKDRCHNAGF